jgi:peroxiredoxin (alkyl hydroperoxide reductase subunit C)
MADTVGCARPTGRVVGQTEPETTPEQPSEREEPKMSIMVGRKAPDFEAPAYHKGEFTQVKLSDALGHWALLCFYPGDFTFV